MRGMNSESHKSGIAAQAISIYEEAYELWEKKVDYMSVTYVSK
jgi:hypothetical protein